jgi:hypothetical protein
MVVLPDRHFAPSALAAALVAVLCVPTGVQAQSTPAPDDAAAPAVQAAPPAEAPPRRPGFLDTLNNWFDKGAADLKRSLEKSGQAAKDATEALTKLPGARVVDGRERCAVAANGAPDCVAAAEAICKSKGFSSGKSLETQATQKCPARVWLSGRTPAEGECAVETFVIRSVCQ